MLEAAKQEEQASSGSGFSGCFGVEGLGLGFRGLGFRV